MPPIPMTIRAAPADHGERVTIFVLLASQCDLDCVVRLQEGILRVFAWIGNRNVIQNDAALCY
jgi:hypothetical protein